MRHLFLSFSVFICFLISSVNLQAALHTETVEYKDGDAVLEGYLAYDDAVAAKETKTPGVLVVHEWTGLGDYAKKRADLLAKLGYVAFAADIYGKGIRPQTPEEAGQEAAIYKNDRPLMRERAKAALEVLKSYNFVDSKRIAAIGYCFGGTTVLELARSGADIAGVVSFHGGLNTPVPEDAKNIKAKLLILHGRDDPYVPKEEVESFKDEMKKGNTNYQFISYGNTVHSFTNPDAGDDKSKGVAYNPAADRHSWQEMQKFFEDIFK